MRELYILSFLHQTATIAVLPARYFQLYILSFLHQTATEHEHKHLVDELYILSFLHQTATYICQRCFPIRCISYLSYIKPQHSILS